MVLHFLSYAEKCISCFTHSYTSNSAATFILSPFPRRSLKQNFLQLHLTTQSVPRSILGFFVLLLPRTLPRTLLSLLWSCINTCPCVCLVTLLWDSLVATLAVAVHCLVKQIVRWSNRVQPAPKQDICLPKPFICHLPISIFTCVMTPMQVSMCLPKPHCFPFSHKWAPRTEHPAISPFR